MIRPAQGRFLECDLLTFKPLLSGEQDIEMKRQRACIGLIPATEEMDVSILKPNGKYYSKQFKNDYDGMRSLFIWVGQTAPGTELHFCILDLGMPLFLLTVALVSGDATIGSVSQDRLTSALSSYDDDEFKDRTPSQIVAFYCERENPEDFGVAVPELRELNELLQRHILIIIQIKTLQRETGSPQVDERLASISNETLIGLEEELRAQILFIREYIPKYDSLKSLEESVLILLDKNI